MDKIVLLSLRQRALEIQERQAGWKRAAAEREFDDGKEGEMAASRIQAEEKLGEVGKPSQLSVRFWGRVGDDRRLGRYLRGTPAPSTVHIN